MTLLETGTTHACAESAPVHARRSGIVLAVAGLLAEAGWLVWRVIDLPVNVVALVVLVAEFAGVAGTIAITVGLARARHPRDVFVDDPGEAHRFAFAVADLVGRTRSSDVHRDVARAVRAVSRRRPPRRSAEVAMGAVMLEGPRRLVLVLAVVVGLVAGMAPLTRPPSWAAAALATGVILTGASHVVLGRGRIRFGDRTRWSYASIGEVVGAADLDGLAPRRWVGTIAAIVVVNLAVALRGISDRWTHGLDPMGHDARLGAILVAVVLVGGALYTMCTIPAPVVDQDRWSRRLEERATRRSALGATVVFGLVGLVAGVVPGGADRTDEPARIEHLVDGGPGAADR